MCRYVYQIQIIIKMCKRHKSYLKHRRSTDTYFAVFANLSNFKKMYLEKKVSCNSFYLLCDFNYPGCINT